MNVTVFEAINITKKYRNTLALNQVSMSVMQGDIYGFIGENGAGKTTMIRLLTGLAEPTTGKILYSVKAIRNLQSSVSALAVLLRALLFILI
jgi:ABC-2 type transport system ATP-binding protein